MSTVSAEILKKCISLSGIKIRNGETHEETALRALDEIEKKIAKKEIQYESDYARVGQVLNVIMALAQLDYSKKATVSDSNDHIDGLAAGINMLGEELEKSTVSLHEKEVLLKEIHHRVKNNLQIISSLLNLQAEQIDDVRFREKHNASRDRIRSMALVHEQLYESGSLTRINFPDYIETLLHSLNFSYNPDNNRIRLETQIDVKKQDRFFKIETAIPCGLILNELLSNAFKYAFPGEKEGTIRIRFSSEHQEGKRIYELHVSDDGIGLPETIRFEQTESLGLQLIRILSEQLDGEIHFENNPGASFQLRFAPNN